MSTQHTERYHAIDALRALAMFLGVVLHAALSFMVTEGPYTPRHDRSQWEGFDLAVTVIHSFRMQLFFLVAGIFTALILGRRTPQEFLVGRMKRIALPLLGASAILTPLTVAPFLLAAGVGLFPRHWQFIYWSTPGQFWFLVYLLAFSVAAWVLVLLRRATGVTLQPVLAWLGGAAVAWWGIPLFVLATALLTLPMHDAAIDTPDRWMPAPPTLAYYGLFFLVGYAVQLRGSVMRLGRGWQWILPVTVVVLVPLSFSLLLRLLGEVAAQASADAHENVRAGMGTDEHRRALVRLWLLTCAVQTLCTWGLVLGLFGLFGRIFARMRPRVRWLADSSYWVYLVHLPIVYFLAYWLADVQLFGIPDGSAQALIKFAIILAVASAISLGSYALLVRPTFLEAYVGGAARAPHVTRTGSKP